jgi:hypothetical protein
MYKVTAPPPFIMRFVRPSPIFFSRRQTLKLPARMPWRPRAFRHMQLQTSGQHELTSTTTACMLSLLPVNDDERLMPHSTTNGLAVAGLARYRS